MLSPKKEGKYFYQKETKLKKIPENLKDSAVLKTLCYKAVFRYPISIFQLYSHLMSPVEKSLDEVRNELNELVNLGIVRQSNGRFFLHLVNTVDYRLRLRQTKELLSELNFTFMLLGKIPWVKMLAITGAASALNAKEDDDVDVFIITLPNRVWIVRFFVVLLLKAVGKYRIQKDPKRKICPNIYIDEQVMQWDKEKQNLFIASEIIMMKPLVNKNDTYFKFLSCNRWIIDYFGNFKIPFIPWIPPKYSESALVNVLESTLKFLQKIYMRNKITNEIIMDNLIHFNKKDSSEEILKKFEEIIERVSTG